MVHRNSKMVQRNSKMVHKMIRIEMGIQNRLLQHRLGMRFGRLTIQRWRELHMIPIQNILMGKMGRLMGIHIHLLRHKWAIITSRWTIQRLGHILHRRKRMVMKHMKLLKLRISHLCHWLRSRKSRSRIQLIQLELRYKFLELQWSRMILEWILRSMREGVKHKHSWHSLKHQW